jgi:hypothetical protein
MFFSDWIRNKLICWLSHEPEHPADRLSDFDLLKDEIKVGDILLVEGQSQVSRIIKTVTQSPWSHAAIYIGRTRDIKTLSLRNRATHFYGDADDTPLLAEAILGKGTILTPLEEYRPFRLRLCRPSVLSLEDRNMVISYVIEKLGTDYDIRQVLDLARFMFPYGVLPRRWRSSLFHHNAGPETRTVCSTLIAQAFQDVSYPILPVLQEDDFGYKELSHRNSRLFSPLDFDISPWFDILKFPLQSFDDEASYSKMPWAEQGNQAKD